MTALRAGRAPYGARGLKFLAFAAVAITLSSRPVWGAWIEMSLPFCIEDEPPVAPRMGRVD